MPPVPRGQPGQPASTSVRLDADSPGPTPVALTGAWSLTHSEFPPFRVSFECANLHAAYETTIESIMFNVWGGP
jgi:hypothetical protein